MNIPKGVSAKMEELSREGNPTIQAQILTWEILKNLYNTDSQTKEPVIWLQDYIKGVGYELKWRNCGVFVDEDEITIQALDLSIKGSPFKVNETIKVMKNKQEQAIDSACILIKQALV